MTVGPELFFHMLELLDETGYLSASLYSPFGVSGIESLGAELAEEMIALTGAPPTHVVVTHAGGGNTTGTARWLERMGAREHRVIVSASVDPRVHMASDATSTARASQPDTPASASVRTWPTARRAAQRPRSLRTWSYLPHRHARRGLLRDRGPLQARGSTWPSGNTRMAGRCSLRASWPPMRFVGGAGTESRVGQHTGRNSRSPGSRASRSGRVIPRKRAGTCDRDTGCVRSRSGPTISTSRASPVVHPHALQHAPTGYEPTRRTSSSAEDRTPPGAVEGDRRRAASGRRAGSVGDVRPACTVGATDTSAVPLHEGGGGARNDHGARARSADLKLQLWGAVQVQLKRGQVRLARTDGPARSRLVPPLMERAVQRWVWRSDTGTERAGVTRFSDVVEARWARLGART